MQRRVRRSASTEWIERTPSPWATWSSLYRPNPSPHFSRTVDFFLAAFPSSSVFLPSLGKPFVGSDSSSQSMALQWEPLATMIDVAGLYLIGKGAGSLRMTRSS
jgi:hypothetical protein